MGLQPPELFVSMSEMNLVKARSVLSGTYTPIIALTAHATVGYSDKCQQAGMDHYLTKPFQEEELYAILRQVFQKLPA